MPFRLLSGGHLAPPVSLMEDFPLEAAEGVDEEELEAGEEQVTEPSEAVGLAEGGAAEPAVAEPAAEAGPLPSLENLRESFEAALKGFYSAAGRPLPAVKFSWWQGGGAELLWDLWFSVQVRRAAQRAARAR